jgi:decaprenylphospho-beta-D-erythro-pentofuranosid-2-ulose 2-reductase
VTDAAPGPGVLVLGGYSEIGLAISAKLATPTSTTVLAGRDRSRLGVAAAALRQQGAGRIETLDFDATDTASHHAVVAAAAGLAGRLDIVVVAFGLLDEDPMAGPEGDARSVAVAATNYVGAVSVGLAAAHHLRDQGHGTIVFLSSVAGERVRRDNLVYGSSKAGLDGFAQGLGDALSATGARVLVVRPGWVRGRMTAGRRPAPMATTPEAVATATVAALRAGREVVWVPGALRWVFAGFRHLPRGVWRRLPAPR